jgi:hypothetical protein
MQHLSKEFRIETVDHKLKKLYKQTWDGQHVRLPPEDHGLQEPPLHAYHFPSRLRPFRYGYSTPIESVADEAGLRRMRRHRFYRRYSHQQSQLRYQEISNYAELFIGKRRNGDK